MVQDLEKSGGIVGLIVGQLMRVSGAKEDTIDKTAAAISGAGMVAAAPVVVAHAMTVTQMVSQVGAGNIPALRGPEYTVGTMDNGALNTALVNPGPQVSQMPAIDRGLGQGMSGRKL